MLHQYHRSVKVSVLAVLLLTAGFVKAQTPLITNIPGRHTTSLDGKWQYIADPYETGFYDYRFKERNEKDREAYWNSDIPDNKTDRKEHGYIDKYTLNVPGDWNSQDTKFVYYEGTVWYKRTFDYTKSNAANQLFIYFGAVNYRADVYLNGKKLGMHKGGFTPFNFVIPDSVLKPTGNFLVVKVDNKRSKDEVPTVNTDWWNYGGIHRSVKLVEVPASYIGDYSLQLTSLPVTDKKKKITTAVINGWVKIAQWQAGDHVQVEIPELKISQSFAVTDSLVNISLQANALQVWSPENPKLYTVNISTASDKLQDKIGFRTVKVSGKQILLNDKPVFLRGISIHAEIPQDIRRAYSYKDALQLLGWAKELNCNMVRLAHYPHDENMTRVADSLGLLVWSEIPVYWTIDFTSKEVYEKAKGQLQEMITRDRNRASIIIWSVGNETPVTPIRTEFMRNLLASAKKTDSTRLVSAALEVHYNAGLNTIDDPLGQYTDIVGVNEYLGWYNGLPDNCRTASWSTIYDKPLFFSETGAEALGGFHGDSLTRWSEEYQEWFYKEQIAMMKRMPDNFTGLSPWILADFRAPRRNNPVYQEGWNNKGLIDHEGKKKKAFHILKAYYDEMEKNAPVRKTAKAAHVKTSTVGEGWANNSVNVVAFRKNSLVTSGNTQYTAYYDNDRYLVLAKRKTGDAQWEVHKTQYQGNTADAHNTISIMTDVAGYLHVSWDHHNNPLRYSRSKTPGSLELTDKMPMTGKLEERVSYPEFFRQKNGNLLFFYRNGQSGEGNLVMNEYNVKTQQWTQLHSNLINGEGKRNAYWQSCIDAKGTIHISWVWRESADVASNHDLCYARSTDGGKTWERSDGQKYQLPITAASAEYACMIPQNSQLINQTSMFADAQGRPYIATYWCEAGTKVPQYHIVYLNSNGWQTQNLAFRQMPFSLSGTGTKRIPVARPQIIAWEQNKQVAAALIFRDAERNDKVSAAVTSNINSNQWRIIDLTDYSVGQWEPTYDTELWKQKQLLHLFVQKAEQVDGEGKANIPPTPVQVLEWAPLLKNNNKKSPAG